MRIPWHRGGMQPQPSSLNQAVLTRDISCHISQNIFGTESAYLIPRTEEHWFNTNEMLLYSSRPDAPESNSADTTRKVLLLRSDLHHLFDQGRLVFLPKGGAWVVHILSGWPDGELAALYHNVSLEPLSELSVEFLLTRFAWTVLSQDIFLRAGSDRRLVTVQGDEVKVETVSGLDCLLKFTPVKDPSRSQSPKKRAQGAGSQNQDDDGDAAIDWDHNDWDDNRGRKRWRSSWVSSPPPFAACAE